MGLMWSQDMELNEQKVEPEDMVAEVDGGHPGGKVLGKLPTIVFELV